MKKVSFCVKCQYKDIKKVKSVLLSNNVKITTDFKDEVERRQQIECECEATRYKLITLIMGALSAQLHSGPDFIECVYYGTFED